jgi:HD-GYP domain-containing protein (c-di-GMP phosphodiesterase class II)
MVLYHHERYDGKGYPNCLKGVDIPLGARIITVADSLSAMLQNRPYRQAKKFQLAYNEIVRCSGTQFDPRVVAAFCEAAPIIESILEALSEESCSL